MQMTSVTLSSQPEPSLNGLIGGSHSPVKEVDTVQLTPSPEPVSHPISICAREMSQRDAKVAAQLFLKQEKADKAWNIRIRL